MNNTPPSTPPNPTETNNNEVSLQTLRVIGLIVLISGYILVALSEVGTLKNLLLQPNTTPNLAEVDPFKNGIKSAPHYNWFAFYIVSLYPI